MLIVNYEIHDSDTFGSPGWEQRQTEIVEKLKSLIKDLNIARGGVSIHITTVKDIRYDDVKKSYWKKSSVKKTEDQIKK